MSIALFCLDPKVNLGGYRLPVVSLLCTGQCKAHEWIHDPKLIPYWELPCVAIASRSRFRSSDTRREQARIPPILVFPKVASQQVLILMVNQCRAPAVPTPVNVILGYKGTVACNTRT